MAASDKPTFTIFGAGLAGALLAARLASSGHRVRLFERRSDPRTVGAERGRSINLALSTRGLHALGTLGLADKALALAIPMRGRMIHPLVRGVSGGASGGGVSAGGAPTAGPLAYQPYSPDGVQAINSISRAGLNMLLLDAAERAGAAIDFGVRCVDVDFAKREAMVVEATPGGEPSPGGPTAITFETCIGADGAFSAVRTAMTRLDRFSFSQEYLEHAYKELTIPAAATPGAGPAGEHLLEKHALHIWPRRSYMLIALPNLDGSFTCTLFAPREGPDGFDSVRTDEDAVRYMRERFPDAAALMPDIAGDWRANPTSSLVTMRCRPWRIGASAALIGDAAHALVPFYGQGMNASFEDCVSLGECVDEALGRAAGGWEDALEGAYAEFERRRKPHADAIAQLALDNFVEMRDKVGTKAFLRHKRNEQRLARWFPKWFTPLYSMVSFSTIPYADAVEKAREQEETLARIRSAALAIGGLVVVIALAIALALLLGRG